MANPQQEVETLRLEIARLQATLLETQQSKNKFLSTVTHELRIPMTSIKGYTDLLRQGAVGPVNEMQTNFLNVVRSNVERMAALLSDLADMNRVEGGRLKLELGAVELAGCVNEALQSQSPHLEEKGLPVEVDLPGDLPHVRADRARVVQALNNLLSNACKFTPPGGSIRLRAMQAGERVRVEVRDSGIGISPADQEKLFTPFFRSEDPAVREQTGWGLGLHVTKLLVELMGGETGAQGALGQGSTFWLELPIEA